MVDLHVEEDGPEKGGEESRKVLGLALAVLAVLAVAAALVYFLVLKKPEKPAPAAPAVPETAAPAVEDKAAAAAGPEPLAFPAVPLVASDAAVRDFAAALSADPEFAKWLLTKDLIRTFVVSVDNVANGLSPKSHVDFYAPKGSFRVARTKQGTFVDPASYARYEALVGIIRSFDAAAAARLYRAVDPLIQEAYNELGYPGADFDDTLVRAMGELLGTPVVEGPIRVEPKVLSFALTDPVLEGLSGAQKQLLRLGPKGVQAAHDKILALAAALGIAPSKLPTPRTYTTAPR